jgi:hypothetical protein
MIAEKAQIAQLKEAIEQVTAKMIYQFPDAEREGREAGDLRNHVAQEESEKVSVTVAIDEQRR